MKVTILLAAAFALTTSAAMAQVAPSTNASGTTVPMSNPQGTMNSTNGGVGTRTNPAQSGIIDDRMRPDRADTRGNKRMMRKDAKMKTKSDGTMKTKM